jgi:hypothetical protein
VSLYKHALNAPGYQSANHQVDEDEVSSFRDHDYGHNEEPAIKMNLAEEESKELPLQLESHHKRKASPEIAAGGEERRRVDLAVTTSPQRKSYDFEQQFL